MCLREAQKLMVTILKDIDKICSENNINYWIESGTLLGAIRHKGFIPWDDDIDIGMLRQDYEKFVDVCDKRLPEDLFINNYKKNKDMICQWSKVVHKNSEFIEESGVTGLFVDIFPYDFYDEEGNVLKKKMKLAKRYEININSNKNFSKPFIKSLKKNSKILFCKFLSFFVKDKDFSKFYNSCNEISRSSNIKNNKVIGYGVEVSRYNNFFNLDDIFPLKKIKFENIEVFAPNNVNNCLKEYYGENYMEMPKKELRVYHNKGIKIICNRE